MDRLGHTRMGTDRVDEDGRNGQTQPRGRLYKLTITQSYGMIFGLRTKNPKANS